MKVVHLVLDPGNPSPLGKNVCALAVMTKAPQAGAATAGAATPAPEAAPQNA